MRIPIGLKLVVLVLLTAAVGLMSASGASAGTFGFTENGFVVSAVNKNGTPDTQAGSHPYEYTTTVEVNTELVSSPNIANGDKVPVAAGGDVKDIEVNLPPGLVGDPSATPQCTLQEFRASKEGAGGRNRA